MQQQQEEEEAEKGGRRKKEVEILREAEGKKGGRPVTAVKSPPPSSLLLLSSHPPPSSLSLSLAHGALPTCPSTPLQRTQQHLSSSERCASLELDPARGDLDEGSFAGGRTGTSICAPELGTPSSSRRHACSNHRSAPDLWISRRTRPPPRLWFSHLSCLSRLLPPLPLLFVSLLSSFLSPVFCL